MSDEINITSENQMGGRPEAVLHAEHSKPLVAGCPGCDLMVMDYIQSMGVAGIRLEKLEDAADEARWQIHEAECLADHDAGRHAEELINGCPTCSRICGGCQCAGCASCRDVGQSANGRGHPAGHPDYIPAPAPTEILF